MLVDGRVDDRFRLVLHEDVNEWAVQFASNGFERIVKYPDKFIPATGGTEPELVQYILGKLGGASESVKKKFEVSEAGHEPDMHNSWLPNVTGAEHIDVIIRMAGLIASKDPEDIAMRPKRIKTAKVYFDSDCEYEPLKSWPAKCAEIKALMADDANWLGSPSRVLEELVGLRLFVNIQRSRAGRQASKMRAAESRSFADFALNKINEGNFWFNQCYAMRLKSEPQFKDFMDRKRIGYRKTGDNGDVVQYAAVVNNTRDDRFEIFYDFFADAWRLRMTYDAPLKSETKVTGWPEAGDEGGAPGTDPIASWIAMGMYDHQR